MRRNLNSPMTKFDGTPYDDGATLRDVAFGALQAPLPGDERMDGKGKLAIYALAAKVHAGGVVDLNAEELALLKSRVEAAYPPLVVGKAVELLEQDFAAVQYEQDEHRG